LHTQYFLGILFSSILCTWPNQRNLCNIIVSVIVGFLTIAIVKIYNTMSFKFHEPALSILLQQSLKHLLLWTNILI
jgi:hypothetical protein